MKLKFLHKRKEEKQTEEEAFSLPKFIIERSRAIEIVFLVLVLISALMAPFVEINYDLTEYLPSTVQSKQGLDLMEEKFGYPGTGRIMIDDVSLYEAKAYKDKIEALDGVDQVMWLDTSTSVYAADAFINFNSVDEYYKDNTAVMDIVFVNGDTDKRTSQTIDEIKDILGDKGHYVGMAVQNKSLQENVSSEMKLIMTLAVVVIFLILTVTTNSWFEPVLYLTGHGRGDRPEQRNEPVYRADILFDEQCVGGPAARLLDGLFDFLKPRVCEGKGKGTGSDDRVKQRDQ